ncbi:NAD-dependent epimerase/dehydratase family protein [Amycolatopsis sp. CA-126428]|uniref:NAD-dependent epimerase/dehydratase family protein n=1 Tax=Amycolatopsis sp. CA-126428 TaxID=2073158 RepID=UPI000CD0F995|nr:NAD-dependent epimerase/dehydratase family protein [Amycolatopsis sp. CA-126428]
MPSRDPLAPPRVTVLGASGFVGSAVTAALSRRRIRLRAVARRRSTVPAGGLADVEIRQADLGDPRQLRDVLSGSDAVCHLVLHNGGWRDADGDPASELVNVGVMRELIRFFAGPGRAGTCPVVVFAGSTSQIGAAAAGPVDGTETDRPVTTYDRQKRTAEELLEAASAAGVVKGVSLRLPTVFGHRPGTPFADPGVLAAMMRRALAGEPLTMWHDGTVERDLLHVDDVAAAFLAALDHPDELAGRHWPLGTGRGVRLGDVFRSIASIAAAKTGRPPVPVLSVPPPPHAVTADLADLVTDPARFAAATGWRARTDLPSALESAVDALAATLPEAA